MLLIPLYFHPVHEQTEIVYLTAHRAKQILSEYNFLMEKLVQSCGLSVSDISPIVRLLTGFLHGYATQQLGSALSNPEVAITDMTSALDIILLGIHQKYQQM